MMNKDPSSELDIQPLLEASDGFVEILNLLVSLSLTPDKIIDLNPECRTTCGAVEITASPDLSDGLKDAVAACRTINPQLVLIKEALTHASTQ